MIGLQNLDKGDKLVILAFGGRLQIYRMYEDVGSGEGFQSEFLLADMFHEDLLQLVDDMFFALNFSVNKCTQLERNSFGCLCM